jgi:hypothetical protein
MARIKCKMCTIKVKQWETEKFFGVKCNKHFMPLIILKEHRNKITPEEKDEIKKIQNDKFPKLYFDNTISDSDDHWHIHLSKKNRNITL